MHGTAALSNTDKITLRPQGYELLAPAYVVPPTSARDTLRLIAEQDAELTALRDHISRQGADINALSTDIYEIEAAVGREREAWVNKNAVLSKEVRRLRSPWALGLFAGWDAIHQQTVAGIGVTYKLIGF